MTVYKSKKEKAYRAKQKISDLVRALNLIPITQTYIRNQVSKEVRLLNKEIKLLTNRKFK